jgi:methylated-DNA-[protein]-cysteine S-methyltransferase
VWVALSGLPPQVGPLAAEVSDGHVRRIVFGGQPELPLTAPVGATTDDQAVAAHLTAEVEAYLDGRLRAFTVPLDHGAPSAFARRVYGELLTVEFGQTVTYGQLAVMAGRPGAARAVGTAMATNPLPLVVPCHRVVPASGGPGQYGGGATTKSFLLAMEARMQGNFR